MITFRVSHDKRVSTIEDKLFYDEMQRFNKKKLSYDADIKYTFAQKLKLLKSELSLTLTTIEGSRDRSSTQFLSSQYHRMSPLILQSLLIKVKMIT